jgi:EAL domain-containing protein (putative c-di-GMP-specific phosphodiesterase class I)
VRWKHPTEGYISPVRFIPVAEETGLIVQIGDFVLRRVATDMSAWRAQGATLVPVAVNVSSGQLSRSNLRETVGELVRSGGLTASMLQIELTEGAMFEQLESRQGESKDDTTIAELRDMGVRVTIMPSSARSSRWRSTCASR